MSRGLITAKPVETTISGGGFRTVATARRYVLTVETIVSPSCTSRLARLGASSKIISSVVVIPLDGLIEPMSTYRTSRSGSSFSATTSSLVEAVYFSFLMSQCSGTSPVQSLPEDFMRGSGSNPASRAALGGSPLVTARVITALRYSARRSISNWCLAVSWSIRAVSRSRNAAMADCSSRGGSGITRFLSSLL